MGRSTQLIVLSFNLRAGPSIARAVSLVAFPPLLSVRPPSPSVLVSVLGRPSALETTLKLCRSSLGTFGRGPWSR